MRPGHLLALALAAVPLAGCLNLDVFVFRAKSAAAGTDLMADSQVPERLRSFKTDVPVEGGTSVSVYVMTHDGGEGDVAEDPARKDVTIFYCHGQSNHIGTNHTRVEALWKLGYTVASVDPRGYGLTQGSAHQAGVEADLRAARAYVEGLAGVDPARFAIYGRSLGSAMCLSLLTEKDVPAVVLESPIGNMQAFVNDSLGIEAPTEWFFDASFDNFSTIQLHTGPLLVMHGDADDFVQPKYGKGVSDSADGHASPNEFWSVPGADHGDVPCLEKRSVDASKDADTRPNACAGGFDPEYFTKVTAIFDTLKPAP